MENMFGLGPDAAGSNTLKEGYMAKEIEQIPISGL